ncbi:hypothetical protein [Bacillus marinisedimentorum]|nr:hypothetical protein [Bacillus marinisedimentorum]
MQTTVIDLRPLHSLKTRNGLRSSGGAVYVKDEKNPAFIAGFLTLWK